MKEKIQSTIIQDLLQPDLSLLDALPGMMYRRINDGNWSLVFVSEGCEELFGLTAPKITEANDRSFTQYLHPSSKSAFEDLSKKITLKKPTYHAAYITNHTCGWDRWVADYGRGVFNKSGNLLYVDGFLSDCSGYKAIQNQMTLQLETFKHFYSNYRFGDIIGRSPAMQTIFNTLVRLANSSENVIIYGESGTGKELTAREIHRIGKRAAKPFIPVNCGAIPENLMESELFGYKKGAFSGADKDKQGILEVAHGGTLFLDEIGEIPESMQIKLLRALEGDGFTPVGGCEVVHPDIHIIAATNRDLHELVRVGKIRSDFYYRINIIPIKLPPLRERKEDIPLLFGHFMGKSPDEHVLSGKALRAAMAYSWPGNVRELKNQVRQFTTLGQMDIAPEHTAILEPPLTATGKTLKQYLAHCEAEALATALSEHQWNRTQVARILGIDRRTLFEKIKKYGLNSKN